MQLSAEPADCLCGTLTKMWESFDFFDFVSLLFFCFFLCLFVPQSVAEARRGEARTGFFFPEELKPCGFSAPLSLCWPSAQDCATR